MQMMYAKFKQFFQTLCCLTTYRCDYPDPTDCPHFESRTGSCDTDTVRCAYRTDRFKSNRKEIKNT